MQTLSAEIIFFAAVAISLLGLTITAQSVLDERKLNDEMHVVLMTRDLTDVANDLAKGTTSSTNETLRAIIVFARAGHRDRLRKAIVRLSMSLPEKHEDRFHVNRIVRRAIDNQDLASLRLFYERFAPYGDEHASDFIKLWRETGDLREFEQWLATRAHTHELWWDPWYDLRASLGTADALVDELAEHVRKDPTNWYLVERYLRKAGHARDVSWLAQVVHTELSYNAYELGSLVHPYNSELAVKLLERSLGLPFTDSDRTAFADRAFRTASISPKIGSPEKQLRYWTMKMLASTYQKAGRPELAQPYAERLTAMDTSDIQTSDAFGLAGAVQMASGQRVVESRILQNEVKDRELPQYWLERASYYRGRNEPDSMLDTLKQALAIFVYRPAGAENNLNRLLILDALSNVHGPSSRKNEVAQVFRSELASLNSDPIQQFAVARMLLFDFDELLAEHYLNNLRLGSHLSARPVWEGDENIIEYILEFETWDAEKRTALVRELSSLAQRRLKTRAFFLAKAIADTYPAEAVPLLEKLRTITPIDELEEWSFDREDVENLLFKVYLRSGKWRQAEKMFNENYSYWGTELSGIAVAAAEAGDIKDAVRIWTLNSNLDRRKIGGLETLSKTGAKPALRELYLKIKKRDPLSYVPDKALAVLK